MPRWLNSRPIALRRPPPMPGNWSIAIAVSSFTIVRLPSRLWWLHVENEAALLFAAANVQSERGAGAVILYRLTFAIYKKVFQ